MNYKSIKKVFNAPKIWHQELSTVYEIVINNFKSTAKKLLFLFCLLVFCFILSSCSNSSKNSENTIKVWHIQNLDSQASIKERAGERFKNENPDYDYQMSPMQNDAYKTQIQIALGANNAPDIFSIWGGGTMIEYIKSGKIIDLTQYISKYDLSNKLIPVSLSQVSYEGKIWAVPVESIVIAMVLYNKEMFEQNGWQVPKTVGQLETLMNKMLAKGIKPFALANKTKWTGSMYYMSLVQRIGGTKVFYDAANRVNGGSFENPAFIEAGKKLVEWVDKGYFNQGFNGLDDDSGQARALLYTGKAAMELIGTFRLASMSSENPNYVAKLDGFIFPAIENGKGNPKELVGTAGDNFYAIASTSKYPEEAFKLITKFIDEQAVKESMDIGRIPPVVGVNPQDTISKKVVEAVNEAPEIQLWYDQYLPPELAQVHLDTLQAMMGKTMTPEEACRQLEAKAMQILGPSSK